MISLSMNLKFIDEKLPETQELQITGGTGYSMIKTGTLLITIIFLVLPFGPACQADESEDAVQFTLGQKQYAAGDYDAAINSFSNAVSLAPDNAVYHHWLGKSYGMLAQESSLLTAYSLSRKTRRELERAVELDDRDVDALTDLMEFYRRAPGFLGGGEEKVDELNAIKDTGKEPEPEKS